MCIVSLLNTEKCCLMLNSLHILPKFEKQEIMGSLFFDNNKTKTILAKPHLFLQIAHPNTTTTYVCEYNNNNKARAKNAINFSLSLWK